MRISGARPCPVSRHVLARFPRHSEGNLGRGAGCGAGWVVTCVLFYFCFSFFCAVSVLSFFFVCCFFSFMDEGWIKMLVHAKREAPLLTFGCGLDGERTVVNLEFFGWLWLSSRPQSPRPCMLCPLPGLLTGWCDVSIGSGGGRFLATSCVVFVFVNGCVVRIGAGSCVNVTGGAVGAGGVAFGKRELFQKLVQIGLPGKLERICIVPVVSRAMDKSFANKRGNVKAIAEYGLGSALNRILLDDPDITCTITSNGVLEKKTLPYGNNTILPAPILLQPNSPTENDTNVSLGQE